MPILPLFGTSTQGRSSNATAQRRVNLYAEPAGDPDKTALALYGRPGLRVGFNELAPLEDSLIGGPLRGIISYPAATNPSNEYIYAAQGNKSLLGTAALRFLSATEFFETSSGVVQFAQLGNNVFAVDGETAYQMGVGSFDVAGITGFPDGARSIVPLGQRLFVEDTSSAGKFRWCGVGDATDWDALNFATAEGETDPLVQLSTRGGELLLFGTRTMEFWALTGGTDVVARVGGAAIDWGLAYFDSPRKAQNTVLFIGRNLGGEPQVCALDGYAVRVVSTPDIDRAINDAIGRGVSLQTTVITSVGHTWYLVHLDTTSLAFDLTTGIWGEWQTEGGRFCGQYAAPYRNSLIVTDYRDGRVYYVDSTRQTDGDAPIVREVQSRHMFADLRRVKVGKLHLDCEVGGYTRPGYGGVQCIECQDGNPVATAVDGATTTASFTVECWLQLEAYSNLISPQKRVLQKNIGADWKMWVSAFGADTGTYKLSLGSGANVSVNSAIPYTAEEEFHAAFVFDSVAQTLTGYKNGVLVGTDTGIASMNGAAATTSFIVGGSINTGRIGLVRIWDGARTEAEILANMTTELPTGTSNMVNQWAQFPAGAEEWASNGSDGSTLVAASLPRVGWDGGYFTSELLVEPAGAKVMLQVSRDGGHTFGNELWRSMGRVGEYGRQVAWHRLGISRDFVYRLRIADPVKVVLLNASLDVSR